MHWQVDFYEEDDGTCPVERFLSNLSPRPRAKLLAMVRILEEQGPTLPFPYSSQVRGRLRELRTQHGKEKLRILYFADPRRVFILHGIVKRTNRLAESDIRIAEERMGRHLRRLERK